MKLSDAEWTVMNAVWQDAPATVRDVLERVESDTHWAYTTVKTILARLTDKGALRMTKRANTSVFEPTVTRGEARRAAVRALIDRAFDGAFGSLVHHLVDDDRLTREDRRILADMMERLGDDGGTPP